MMTFLKAAKRLERKVEKGGSEIHIHVEGSGESHVNMYMKMLWQIQACL